MWPPPAQKTDWINADVQEDLHPTAHNDIALTLANDFTPQIAANITDIAQNASDIAAHEALYSDTGYMTLSVPTIRSANGLLMRNGSDGSSAHTLTGMNQPRSDRDTSTTFPGNGTWSIASACSVTFDMTLNESRGCYFQVQCSGVFELKPNETVLVKPAYRIDGGTTVYATDNVRGYATNPLDPGTLKPDVMSLLWTVYIAGGDSITFYLANYGSTGTIESTDKRISAVANWR